MEANIIPFVVLPNFKEKKMKHTLLFFIMVICLSCWHHSAQAVEVGDIYYHDGTFDRTVRDDKVPVGLVYWVSRRRDYGYILSLEQPASMNFSSATAYCENYVTLGTKAGDWRLPYVIELARMGNERIKGVSNTKFDTLNAKLQSIPNGQQLLSNKYYWVKVSGTNGLMYLNTYGIRSTTSSTSMFYPRCVKMF